MSDTIKTLITPNATKLQLDLEAVFAERLAKLGAPNRYVTYPETTPSNILPWLGWERHVDVWDDSWEESIKRDLTKNSFLLHKRKGTLGALKDALRIFHLDDINIQEWFEYESDPYLFRVIITLVNPGFDLSQVNDIIALITIAKNARSHLEDLQIILITTSDVPVIGAGMLSGEMTTILPLKPIAFSLETTTPVPVMGGGILSGEVTTMLPLKAITFSLETTTLTPVIGGSMLSGEDATIHPFIN